MHTPHSIPAGGVGRQHMVHIGVVKEFVGLLPQVVGVWDNNRSIGLIIIFAHILLTF